MAGTSSGSDATHLVRVQGLAARTQRAADVPQARLFAQTHAELRTRQYALERQGELVPAFHVDHGEVLAPVGDDRMATLELGPVVPREIAGIEGRHCRAFA